MIIRKMDQLMFSFFVNVGLSMPHMGVGLHAKPPTVAQPCLFYRRKIYILVYTYLPNHIRSNTKKMHIYHLVLENDNIYNNHILFM